MGPPYTLQVQRSSPPILEVSDLDATSLQLLAHAYWRDFTNLGYSVDVSDDGLEAQRKVVFEDLESLPRR